MTTPRRRRWAKSWACWLLIAVTGSTPGSAAGDDPDSGSPPEVEVGGVRLFWKDGARLEALDGLVRLRVRGRFDGQAAFFGSDRDLEDLVGGLSNDAEDRRARVTLQGEVGPRFHFKAQSDFADKDFRWKSVYVGLSELPGDLTARLGSLKEPFGLERLTSSRHVTFLERGLTAALSPPRNTGLVVFGATPGERMTGSLGLFRSVEGLDSVGIGGDQSRALTIRATGLPWVSPSERSLLHLGAAYSHREYIDNEVRFDSRPEIHLAPDFVDTGKLRADSSDHLGLEAALVRGPVSLQAEAVHAFVDASRSRDPRFDAFYFQASWFVTGENRPYDRRRGRFGRLRPKADFLGFAGVRGLGAWELAVRYSHLDLDDGAVEGGKLHDVSVGVNWYLNASIRILANYVHADRSSSGEVDILGLGLQADF